MRITTKELDPDTYVMKNINKYPEGFSIDV